MLEKSNPRVVVVGGGAGGMMAALYALEAGANVTLLEKNEKLGKKLYITGKGRCNVTNACDRDAFLHRVPRNPRFLYSALDFLPPDRLMALLNRLGCPTKVERGQRVFPVSDKASDVTKALTKGITRAAIRLNTQVDRLVVTGSHITGVRLKDGVVLPADRIVLATGGLSYPSTGSTGDGHRMAEQLGHSMVPTVPSLVPFESTDEWPRRLQGLSLTNVRLTARLGNKELYTDMGEMLFTHFGFSGPLMLTLSSLLSGTDLRQVDAFIDLKPAVDSGQLSARLQRTLDENGRKQLSTILPQFMPMRLAVEFPALCGMDGGKQCSQLTRQEREALVSGMKRIPLRLSGFRPLSEAVVTRGGVNVKDINPSTMVSRRVDGLYFAGELLDVDALTGGFNLHIAFATGALAGHSAAQQYIC